jgi:hypothetical protein
MLSCFPQFSSLRICYVSLDTAFPLASASSCSPPTPQMEDGLEGTASACGQENSPSERKRMGREGGPCSSYPALHSFANACHFLKPPCAACSGSSRFRGWTPCPRPPETRGMQGKKRARRLVPCGVSASSPPLGRELDPTMNAPRARQSAHSLSFRRRAGPALRVACSFSSAFWSKVTRCDPAPPPAPPLSSACRSYRDSL